MPKTPEDILKEAAGAAEAILPSVEKEIDETRKRLAALEAKASQLRAVASVSAAMSHQISTGFYGSTPATNVTSGTSATSTTTTTFYGGGSPVVLVKEHPKPTTSDKIAFVLAKNAKPLSPREIQEDIAERTGEAVPMSTIYYTLAKSKGVRFEEREGSWTLKSEGQG